MSVPNLINANLSKTLVQTLEWEGGWKKVEEWEGRGKNVLDPDTCADSCGQSHPPVQHLGNSRKSVTVSEAPR